MQYSYSNSVTRNIFWRCNFYLLPNSRPWECLCVCNHFDCNGTSCASWSRQMNLGHVKFYVLTPGRHHNIRNLSWISLHRYNHYPSMTLNTPCASSKDLQPNTSSRRFTHLRSAARIFWSNIHQWTFAQQCAQLGQPRQPPHNLVKGTVTSLPTSNTC